MTSPSTRALQRALQPFLERRDLPGALAAAKEYAARCPADVRVRRFLEAFERLVAALNANDAEFADQVNAAGTIPMEGSSTAELHLRMGNFEAALKVYRRLVRTDPSDAEARQKREDVETVLDLLAPDSDGDRGAFEATTLPGVSFSETTRRVVRPSGEGERTTLPDGERSTRPTHVDAGDAQLPDEDLD